jgi:hypothetical protein
MGRDMLAKFPELQYYHLCSYRQFAHCARGVCALQSSSFNLVSALMWLRQKYTYCEGRTRQTLTSLVSQRLARLWHLLFASSLKLDNKIFTRLLLEKSFSCSAHLLLPSAMVSAQSWWIAISSTQRYKGRLSRASLSRARARAYARTLV